MKIAISASGTTLDAEVDPRFGRCQYFIIVDPETMEFEVVDNSSAMASGGAGVSAAQVIAQREIQAVLTGNCGPNAHRVLSTAGITVITGVSGKVSDAIKGYQSGQYNFSSQANVPDHFGMGSNTGTGRGMGMGRGIGTGMGMGFGMNPPVEPISGSQNPEQELQTLKEQSQAMAQQLADIQRRIDEMEKK